MYKRPPGKPFFFFWLSANMLYTYHVTVAVDLLLFYHGDDKSFQRGNEVDLGMNTNPPSHMYDFFLFLTLITFKRKVKIIYSSKL